MGWHVRTIASFAALALAACSVHQKNDLQAETAGPQFANLCIMQEKWPDLLQYMKKFAIAHNLEFHGGIDNITSIHRRQINAYVAQGYSYYFGDDFDLWFVSNPFRENVVTLGGILKRQPITPQQTKLAQDLLRGLSGISTPASGSPDNPNCAKAAAPGTGS